MLWIQLYALLMMGGSTSRIFVNIPIYIQQYVTLHSLFIFWKLLYMFRVLLPPIIKSAYNCIYSIWYLSHRYCYLPLSWRSWNNMFRVLLPPIIRSAYNCTYSVWYLSHRKCYLPLSWKSCSNSSTVAAGSNNGVTNTRRCRYSCMRS